MSVKTYSVGVETINDENPTATEIKFNNEIIWKRGVNPPLRGSMNPFDDYDDETNKESIPPSDTASDTEIKNDTINSDDVQYEDIIENDKSDFTVLNPQLRRRPNVTKDEIIVKNPMFGKNTTISMNEKKTASSKGKETQKFQGNIQPRSTFGGRKTTRKNKKKTKTMRRKRRNL
jgi:hypothetical protein